MFGIKIIWKVPSTSSGAAGVGKELVFPHGSVINITVFGDDYHVNSSIDGILLTVVCEGCKIAHTMRFEIGGMSLISRSMEEDDWKHFSALRRLHSLRQIGRMGVEGVGYKFDN